MLKLSIIISLIAITLIAPSLCNQEQCDVTKFKPIKHVNITNIEGKCYTLYRFRNGEERKTKCMTRHHIKTDDGVTCLTITYYWKNGTITQSEQTAIVTDPTSNKGKLVAISWDPVVVYYAVYTDYENFIFYSACIDGEEYFYVGSVKRKPSKKVLDAIEKGIRKLNVDTSKLVQTCVEAV